MLKSVCLSSLVSRSGKRGAGQIMVKSEACCLTVTSKIAKGTADSKQRAEGVSRAGKKHGPLGGEKRE